MSRRTPPTNPSGPPGPEGAWAVIGLGNPGPSYEGHRHNVGAMVVAALAQAHGESLRPHRTRALVARFRMDVPGGPGSEIVPVIAAQPTTYMNEAGGPIRAMTSYFNINTDHIVAVHDDLELEFGTVRVKAGGGEGGHNGLRSLSKALGTRDYVRLRIGIGRPPGRMEPATFVLKPFSRNEQSDIPFVVDEAIAQLTGVIDRHRRS
ncbi:MAG: aminoacyl-tRNA hydrolase [Austwickia sp.]|nr:aminoacyl-tRNA hydrolase [Austwickia sp.]